MRPPLRVGLIGYGFIAEAVHTGVLISLPNAQLVALAEPDPDRRRLASARAPWVKVYADYLELLDTPEVEAVVACVPTFLHAEVAIAALRRRKHLYLEKPLAMSLEEAMRVINAWQQSDTTVMIGFNYRHNVLYQSAKQYVQSGRLGQPVIVRSVFSSTTRTLPTWKQHRKDGGSALLNLASHHVDLVHFIFGKEVNEVFATERSQLTEGDSATLQLRLADGLMIQSFFSMSAVDEDRFEIYGQNAKVTVDRYHSVNIEIADAARASSRLRRFGHLLRSLVRSPYLLDKILAPRREPSYRAALAHFVDAVQGNMPVTPDIWDGYRSLAVIEAAQESARTGRIASITGRAYADSYR